MKLRTQLIVAFLILAVLPLGAITLYSYHSSTQALRRAVETESARAAAEMETRMATVTAGLSRRFDRLQEIPVPVTVASRKQTGDQPDPAFLSHLIGALGETVGYFEAFEFMPADAPLPEDGAPLEDAPPPGHAPPPEPAAPPVPPGGHAAVRKSILIHLSGLAANLVKDPEVAPLLEKAALLLPPETGMVAGGRFEDQVREIARVVEKRLEAARLQADAGPPAWQEDPEEPAEPVHVSLKKEFACTLNSNGQPLGKLTAKVRTERLLKEVLSQTHGEVGEISFAVDTDGDLFTMNKSDLPKLKEIAHAVHNRRQGAAAESTDTVDSEAGANAASDSEDRPMLAADRHATGGTDEAGVDKPVVPIDLSPDENWVVVTRSDPSTGLIFGIARPVGESLGEIRRASARNLGAGLALASLALFGILPLSRRMTQNLADLTEGAERLAGGDLQTQVPVRSRDELGVLAQSFNRMARELHGNQQRLVEQERLRKELELCRRIQAELLPKAPHRCAFAEVEGLSIPARELGGDFFNYFGLPDGSLALIMGDVSGKGLPAALLMSNLQATLRARVPVEGDLAEFVTSLDHDIEGSTPSEVYVTLFLCIIDPARRELRYVNAGHESPYRVGSDGCTTRLEPTGRPVGLMAGGRYEEKRIPLNEGDRLFLYTDGLTDAEDAGGTPFGGARLEAVLASGTTATTGGARDLLSRVERAYQAHRGGIEAADDATLLVLRVTGWPADQKSGSPLRLVRG